MIKRAVQAGRDEALADLRALLRVPDEEQVREWIREAIDQHYDWEHRDAR